MRTGQGKPSGREEALRGWVPASALCLLDALPRFRLCLSPWFLEEAFRKGKEK